MERKCGFERFSNGMSESEGGMEWIGGPRDESSQSVLNALGRKVSNCGVQCVCVFAMDCVYMTFSVSLLEQQLSGL